MSTHDSVLQEKKNPSLLNRVFRTKASRKDTNTVYLDSFSSPNITVTPFPDKGTKYNEFERASPPLKSHSLPLALQLRSLSSEINASTPSLVLRNVPSNSSTASSNNLSRKSLSPKLSNNNYRHSTYQPRVARFNSGDEVALSRGIDRLKLLQSKGSTRTSFDTDTDSDKLSMIGSSYGYDDYFDSGSTATSEVRRSTDSLTPSEMELRAAEYRAEDTIEEQNGLLVRADSDESIELTGTSTLTATTSTSSTAKSSEDKFSINKSAAPLDALEDPKRYLNYLETTFNKNELGSLLAKKDTFHNQVLNTFMDTLNFKDMSIDMALRSLLGVLYLPKEGQQIDRIINVFSKRYYEANKDLFVSAELVHSLSLSLLMLHTDAHNKLVKNKMSKEEYIKITRQLDHASTIPIEILEILYDNVTSVEFFRDDSDTQSLVTINEPKKGGWFRKWHDNNKVNLPKSSAIMNQMNTAVKLATLLNTFAPEKSPYTYRSSKAVFADTLLRSPFKIKVRGLAPGFQPTIRARPTSGFSIQYVDANPDISELQCLKEGLLLRKSDINETGTKTHLRAWREFWVVLAGSQLVLFKEVSIMKARRQLDGESNPAPKPYSVTSVANAITVLDRDYTKHPNVFRFVTGDGRQYLFRAPSKAEMTGWMTKINFAAAFKTCDVLPRNVSNQAFTTWRNRLPQLQHFEFEEDDADSLRSKVIKNQLNQIDKLIEACERRIESDKQLHKQMGVMVTFTKATQERAKNAADAIYNRLKRAYLDLQRHQCYREILQQDLLLGEAHQASNSKDQELVDIKQSL